MTQAVSILDQVGERIDSAETRLPLFGDVALKLQAMAHQNFDIHEVERLIYSDQALAAEVLRAANSPFFTGLTPASTVRNAVVRLGIQEVVNLVMLATEREKYQVRSPVLQQFMRPLWRHSVGCAIGGQWLAKRLGYQDMSSEVFLGGLIHDVGKLLLARIIDDLIHSGEYKLHLSGTLIQELFQATHAEQGFKLATQWNLSEVYRVTIRDHHTETPDISNSLLLLVRLANLACFRLGIGLNGDPSIILAATQEAYALGAKEVLLAELEIMLEDLPKLSG